MHALNFLHYRRHCRCRGDLKVPRPVVGVVSLGYADNGSDSGRCQLKATLEFIPIQS